MAVNFGLLQPAQPASAFFQGQQDVRAEADRNMLRQQQAEKLQFERENMLAQRGEREALAADRRAKTAAAAERQKFLAGLSAKMAEGGYKLDRPTLGQVLQFGMQTGEDSLIKLATEGMRALDEEARDAAEMARIRPAAGGAAPSIMRQPAAAGLPAAPAAPTNMLAGTPFDIGTVQPAPVNALAAPTAAAPAAAEPMVGGFTRSQIGEMAASNVKSVRERGERLSKLLPKEPAPVAPSEVVKLNRELAAAQAAGDTALAADIRARITRLTEKPVAPQTTIQLPAQEKAERSERGKLLVEQYKVVSDAARLATRTLPALETQERVLDAGFRTGFGAEAQKAGASLLAALGVPEAKDYATNAQAFSAAMSQAVLQKQLEQKGTQTKADADRIEQTGAQLTNTADANRFIINVARAQLKRDIAQRNFYDKWWKENKTYDGAEDAWATGEGNKSLFEDPALKKFAPAPAKPAPAAAPAAAATGTQPFSDAAKERRYQEWKRNQGKP